MKELEMQDKIRSASLPLDPTKHFDVTVGTRRKNAERKV